MQCKQAHEYAHIKCNQLKFMSLLSLLVCFSYPRILIHLFSSMLLPLCPCPTSISFISHLSHCTISPPFNQAFISLYNLSPFVINFHKRYASYWCKDVLFGVDGWDLHFWWTLLEYRNDTTSRYHLELVTCITCILSFYAWVIHLIHLNSCSWGMHSSFDDHLKLRITCGTIILHDWYYV